MTRGALKKEVLRRALSYAFRFKILFDREVGESDSAAFPDLLTRPQRIDFVGVRSL